MFQLVFGFFDVKTTKNWAWFMSQLKRELGYSPVLVVYKDACKGLKNAMMATIRNVEKRGRIEDCMWPAARAYERDI